MVLKDIPADARPREKLLAQGAAALADAELIALLLRTGLQGVPVLTLAQQMLDRFGGLAGLLHTDTERLKQVKGLGPAKRAEIAAVLEIARRSLNQQLAEKPAMNDVDTVKTYLRLHLGGLGQEVFAVLFLDAQLKLIAMETLFHGSLSHTTVHPREVVKRALALGAGAAILAHNHPSGHAEPSRADELLTKQLAQALALVDVRVVDHFIVGAGDVVSFAERGLL